MGWMIVFTCPKTGHDVKSGILMDENTFARIPLEKVKVHCQECGQMHEWVVGQGQLSLAETDKEARWPIPARVA
jgi:transcription elongation factor Elf1